MAFLLTYCYCYLPHLLKLPRPTACSRFRSSPSVSRLPADLPRQSVNDGLLELFWGCLSRKWKLVSLWNLATSIANATLCQLSHQGVTNGGEQAMEGKTKTKEILLFGWRAMQAFNDEPIPSVSRLPPHQSRHVKVWKMWWMEKIPWLLLCKISKDRTIFIQYSSLSLQILWVIHVARFWE